MTNSTPKRIQLSRKKGWRMPPNTVKVDRTNKVFGNRYRVGDDYPSNPGVKIDPDDAVMLFQIFQAPKLPVHELRGKNLACWCKLGDPCHADVLLELANRRQLF
jgi:hypothetical protein